MTAYDLYEQIENGAEDQDGHYVVTKLIQAYYYADEVPGVIIYIQEVFGCDENTAIEVFEIFKREQAQNLLTPEQAALNNETERLSREYKPKCPTCQSTNIQEIGIGERAISIIMLGLHSNKINKSFKCKNCGYTW